jgi:Protein of unknown function (DUF3551)
MRSLHIILPAVGVLAMFIPSAGHADPYKWCAQYSGRGGGGGRNCGFVTFEQCMATVTGIGGFCEPNQFYTGPERRPAPRKRQDRS